LLESVRLDELQLVPGEVHCLQLAMSFESFLMDIIYEVVGSIQPFKRRYSHVLQGCLVQGLQKVAGNVKQLHGRVKPEIHFTIISATDRFMVYKVPMWKGLLS
jgi:hypothetical protein